MLDVPFRSARQLAADLKKKIGCLELLELLPTTWGVPALRDNIAKTKTVVVDRLLAAGVVLFGKSNA